MQREHYTQQATGFRLFNTMTRKKEALHTAGKEVKFYFCGPTVYDFVHIGNLRAYVFADLLRRYLEYMGYKVKLVMNITDVDDKTIRNSQKEGLPLGQFTAKYEKAFFDDTTALRIKPASVYPRATEHIKEMSALINRLLEKGFAYTGEDGSVYFDISKFAGYGKLSKLKLKELKSRVLQDEYTKDEAKDFALWKAWSKDDGSVFWNAFGGKGRPGWHIECSAMSIKHLGTVDIHGGGVDLVFPHHENEIAQSEGAAGGKFANHWVHCEHLVVEGKKMSKSLGNFYTLRDILGRGYSAAALRYLLMAAHYRSQLNFTFRELEATQKTVDNFNAFLKKAKDEIKSTKAKSLNEDIELALYDAKIAFEDHMNDDLNIAEALAAVHRLFSTVNKEMDRKHADAASLKNVLEFLDSVNSILDISEDEEKLGAEELQLILQREELRKKKDFGKADAIRAELKLRGIHVEDTPYGPRWRKKP